MWIQSRRASHRSSVVFLFCLYKFQSSYHLRTVGNRLPPSLSTRSHGKKKDGLLIWLIGERAQRQTYLLWSAWGRGGMIR